MLQRPSERQSSHQTTPVRWRRRQLLPPIRELVRHEHVDQHHRLHGQSFARIQTCLAWLWRRGRDVLRLLGHCEFFCKIRYGTAISLRPPPLQKAGPATARQQGRRDSSLTIWECKRVGENHVQRCRGRRGHWASCCPYSSSLQAPSAKGRSHLPLSAAPIADI